MWWKRFIYSQQKDKKIPIFSSADSFHSLMSALFALTYDKLLSSKKEWPLFAISLLHLFASQWIVATVPLSRRFFSSSVSKCISLYARTKKPLKKQTSMKWQTTIFVDINDSIYIFFYWFPRKQVLHILSRNVYFLGLFFIRQTGKLATTQTFLKLTSYLYQPMSQVINCAIPACLLEAKEQKKDRQQSKMLRFNCIATSWQASRYPC